MRYLFILILVIIYTRVSAQQGVAINTDGSNPHVSAILDVKSTTKGMTTPRMTSAQRIAITSPTAGLLVFDTDMKEFYHHDGSVWRKLLNSNYWQRSSSRNFIYSIGDSVGISTSSPDQRLHVNSGNIYLQDNRNGANLNPHLIFDIPAVDYKEGGLQWHRQGDTLASLDYFANPILSNYLKFTVGKGSSMFLNSSGLGLGSADPQAKLHIRQPDGNEVIRLDAVNPEIEFRKKTNSVITSWTPVGFLQTTDEDDLRIGTYSSNSTGKFVIRTGGNDRVFVNNAGNVGIGTNDPQAKLQISGGTEQLRIFAASDPILQFADGFAFNQVKKGFIQLAGDNLRIGTNSSNSLGSFVVRTNNADRLTIDGGGAAFFAGSVNVATNANITGNANISGLVNIGTNSGPVGYLLRIGGKMICEEVRVKLKSTGWPDYVFSEKYKLPTLQELQSFITKNKHLPNIPSAAEVEKNGLDVGEMQTRMMEKIEELTLYILQLEEKTQKLQAEINNLGKQLRK